MGHGRNNAGSQTILDDGEAFNTSVGSGGGMEIDASGGTDMDALDDGDLIVSGGTSISGQIGEFDFVSDGGLSEEDTISQGAFGAGIQSVGVGGVATSTTVALAGGQQVLVGGSSLDTTLSNGGELLVSSGGIAQNATVGDNALGVVFNGGVALDPTVQSGGLLVALPGGTVVDPKVEPGGSVRAGRQGRLTCLVCPLVGAV